MIKFCEFLDNVSNKLFVISFAGGFMGIGTIIYEVSGRDGARIVAIFSGLLFALSLFLLIISLILEVINDKKDKQQTSSGQKP